MAAVSHDQQAKDLHHRQVLCDWHHTIQSESHTRVELSFKVLFMQLLLLVKLFAVHSTGLGTTNSVRSIQNLVILVAFRLFCLSLNKPKRHRDATVLPLHQLYLYPLCLDICRQVGRPLLRVVAILSK